MTCLMDKSLFGSGGGKRRLLGGSIRTLLEDQSLPLRMDVCSRHDLTQELLRLQKLTSSTADNTHVAKVQRLARFFSIRD